MNVDSRIELWASINYGSHDNVDDLVVVAAGVFDASMDKISRVINNAAKREGWFTKDAYGAPHRPEHSVIEGE